MAAHRAWDDEWLTLPCAGCGRLGHWPRPELGCPCGTVLRIPVTGPSAAKPAAGTWGPPGTERSPGTRDPGRPRTPADPQRIAGPPEPAGPHSAHSTQGPAGPGKPAGPGDPIGPGAPAGREGPAGAQRPTGPGGSADAREPAGSGGPADARQPAGPGGPADAPGPDGARSAPGHRPPFQPRAIRTARDAVTSAARYLRWLGYRDVRRADQRPVHGIGLAARGLLAQVDPTVRPAGPRDVECLWLTAMTESAECVHFSLAGHTDAARAGADALGIPLFVLDLAGVPQPVNGPAEALHTRGAPERGTSARDGRT
ncbi:hypothetical protein [Streptomyces sp. NPDC046870]|uniref:hypothetical protein n=1 Tax=Streptomyces sp. NPDC046870 TaxID=3155135 RepID=UPI0034569BF9